MSRGPQKYTHPITFNVDPDMKEWIKQQADKLYMAESAFVRMLVSKYRSTTK